jgi:protein ImuB
MRIACLHLPAFPLQVAVVRRPELAGQAVAVLSAAPAPRVVFCSRAAHEAGVRAGMSPLAARALVPDLVAVEPAEAQWRAALVDLAGELAALSPVIEPDIHQGALLAEVPPGRRSADVGRALLSVAEAAGYRARVGIAGDRFAARAAARFGDRPLTVVPRGQSAAFLAPLSIELLPLQPEVKGMLRAAGVRTLGEFAALPPPSVDRPGTVDYRELARGNGPSDLAPFGPLRARRRGRESDRQLALVSAAW